MELDCTMLPIPRDTMTQRKLYTIPSHGICIPRSRYTMGPQTHFPFLSR